MRISDWSSDVCSSDLIEGAEYEILDAIVVNRKSFVACVIEFHLIDRHHDDLEKFISAMSDDFVVVHFHANNFEVNERHSYSSFIELSLMARDLLEPGEPMVEHELPLAELDHPSVDWNPAVKPVFACGKLGRASCRESVCQYV